MLSPFIIQGENIQPDSVELGPRIQHQILQKQRELPDGLSPVMAGVPLVVMDGVRRICVGGSLTIIA